MLDEYENVYVINLEFEECFTGLKCDFMILDMEKSEILKEIKVLKDNNMKLYKINQKLLP